MIEAALAYMPALTDSTMEPRCGRNHSKANLHPRIAKFPTERRRQQFEPRRIPYMHLDDDQAMAQRSPSPTHASHVDRNSSCLFQITYTCL